MIKDGDSEQGFLTLPIKELRIEPEIINNFERVDFCGEISVINSEENLFPAIEAVRAAKIAGFDTESRPAFLKGQKFPVSIIQIALEEVAFIFQLKLLGFHPSIMELLADPEVTKIGIGVRDDIMRLKEMKDFEPAGFVDLSSIAKSKGLIQTGARALTARYMGKRLVKSSQKTNWAKTNLTQRQLKYASTDAWVCLKLMEMVQNDDTDYFSMVKALQHSGDE